MKFILEKDKLDIENKIIYNSGSVLYYEADVEYDESWNGLTIEAVIIKKGEEEGVSRSIINNKIYLDKEMSGSYSIGFVGYTIENNEKNYQISTNLKPIIIRKGAGEIETNNENIPTPTEWEIYIAQIQDMIDNIDMSTKQDTLVSGTNIKTINGNSVLGSGNLVIEGGSGGLSSVAHDETLTGAGTNENPLGVDTTEIATKDDLDEKQDTLVSGINIKTINGNSILGSGNINIEGGSTEDYIPYIFDYNFKTGDYEALSGITEVTDGVTVTNGFNNKVVINKYISADDVSYYADVTLQNLNTVLCLSSVESNGGVHSSIVTFDFANAAINVYPKSNGSSMPASPYKTLTLTNVSGLSYKIEVGRKNRDFYARLTNNITGKVEEIIIGDESEGASAYTYPVGWLHDYVAFSQISGNSATWHRVYAYLPKRDVVFLGDSITEGYGVAWKKAWVTLVADEIGHDKVLNMGSSGDQISQCQSIVDTVLTKYKPKVVVVTIGTNGGNTDANVKALYDSIVRIGAYPIFNYIYRGSSSVAANSTIAKLKCEGARFDYETSIDYDLSKAKNSNYFQADGLHLNDTGNEAVATRFLHDCSWIKEFIEKEEQGGDVSEDVAQLKIDMTNVFSELEMESSTEIIQSTFYKGIAINKINGSEVREPTWASNREYIQAKKVRCTDPTYNFVGRYYNTSTGGYNSGTPDGVRYTELDIPNDFYVKISVKRVDGADITSTDATAISNAIEFITIDAGSMISMRLKDIEDRLTALENQQ